MPWNRRCRYACRLIQLVVGGLLYLKHAYDLSDESALKNNFHQVAIAHNVGLASIGVSTMARSQAYKSAIQRISQRRL